MPSCFSELNDPLCFTFPLESPFENHFGKIKNKVITQTPIMRIIFLFFGKTMLGTVVCIVSWKAAIRWGKSWEVGNMSKKWVELKADTISHLYWIWIQRVKYVVIFSFFWKSSFQGKIRLVLVDIFSLSY